MSAFEDRLFELVKRDVEKSLKESGAMLHPDAVDSLVHFKLGEMAEEFYKFVKKCEEDELVDVFDPCGHHIGQVPVPKRRKLCTPSKK